MARRAGKEGPFVHGGGIVGGGIGGMGSQSLTQVGIKLVAQQNSTGAYVLHQPLSAFSHLQGVLHTTRCLPCFTQLGSTWLPYPKCPPLPPCPTLHHSGCAGGEK